MIIAFYNKYSLLYSYVLVQSRRRAHKLKNKIKQLIYKMKQTTDGKNIKSKDENIKYPDHVG